MLILDENVSDELNGILSIEFHRYKREISTMTYVELLMIKDWTGVGNSPYAKSVLTVMATTEHWILSVLSAGGKL